MAQELENNFKNQVVLITGGGSGIGKAAALAFAKAGAQVIIAGRDAKKLKAAAAEISQHGKSAFFKADVQSITSAKALAKKVVEKFSKIDVLVNSAGIYGPIGRFHENSISEWHEAFNINLLGTANLVHEVLPFMVKRKKGKIINLSGGGAVQPFPNFSAYATSKAATVRFTENLAREYEDLNIQVNAIAPGAINTSFLEKVLKVGEKAVGKDFYQKSLQQKKTGGDSPEEAAELMLFLCMSNLTGKIISAKWDKWREFKEAEVAELNKSSEYTLRRIDNKYFKATGLK